MIHNTLAAHESLDLHETINLKMLALAKSKLMQGLVFDQDLKKLMQKDVELGKTGLKELQALYEKASFSGPVPESRPTPIVGEGEVQ